MGGAQEDGEGRVMGAKQFLRNIPNVRPEGWAGPLSTQSTAPQTGLETQGAPRGWP